MAASAGQGGTAWRGELLALLKSSRQEDWDRALTLKMANIPPSLFRYRPPDGNSLKGLRGDSIWLSPADAFNDLHDTSVKIDAVRSVASLLERDVAAGAVRLPADVIGRLSTANDILTALDDTFAAEVERQVGSTKAAQARTFFRDYLAGVSADWTTQWSAFMRRGVKVACFSEVGTSNLLWAHYADSHRGFCVQYDLSGLSPGDLRARLLLPVTYAAEPFQMQVDKVAPNPFVGILAAIHKSNEWAYEREWRIVVPTGASLPHLEWSMPKPTGLLLGANMEAGYRAEVVQAAREKDIPLFEMVASTSGFDLQARPLSA